MKTADPFDDLETKGFSPSHKISPRDKPIQPNWRPVGERSFHLEDHPLNYYTPSWSSHRFLDFDLAVRVFDEHIHSLNKLDHLKAYLNDAVTRETPSYTWQQGTVKAVREASVQVFTVNGEFSHNNIYSLFEMPFDDQRADHLMSLEIPLKGHHSKWHQPTALEGPNQVYLVSNTSRIASYKVFHKFENALGNFKHKVQWAVDRLEHTIQTEFEVSDPRTPVRQHENRVVKSVTLEDDSEIKIVASWSPDLLDALKDHGEPLG